MGISLCQYRMSIGCFNNRISKSVCSSITKFHCSLFLIVKFLLSTLGYLLFLSFLIILLLECGDIECNPGPVDQSDNSLYCDISVCHLNIRSLKVKIDEMLIKMEMIRYELAPKFDIITVSESWLSDDDNIKIS